MMVAHHEHASNRVFSLERKNDRLEVALQGWQEILSLAREHIQGTADEVGPSDVMDVINALDLRLNQAIDEHQKLIQAREEKWRMAEVERESLLRMEDQRWVLSEMLEATTAKLKDADAELAASLAQFKHLQERLATPRKPTLQEMAARVKDNDLDMVRFREVI